MDPKTIIDTLQNTATQLRTRLEEVNKLLVIRTAQLYECRKELEKERRRVVRKNNRIDSLERQVQGLKVDRKDQL